MSLTAAWSDHTQDHKCSWLVVQALLRASAAQRRVLEVTPFSTVWCSLPVAHDHHVLVGMQECYGKHDDASVQRVKALYTEMGIPALYEQQEEDSYKRCVDLIQEAKHVVPPEFFLTILNKVRSVCGLWNEQTGWLMAAVCFRLTACQIHKRQK